MLTLEKRLAKAIRNRRRKQRISQEKCAAAAGIHRTYMSSIERATVSISVGVAAKVAAALNMPLSQLLKDAERLADDEDESSDG